MSTSIASTTVFAEYNIEIKNDTQGVVNIVYADPNGGKYDFPLKHGETQSLRVTTQTKIHWDSLTSPLDLLRAAFKAKPTAEGKPVEIVLKTKRGWVSNTNYIEVNPMAQTPDVGFVAGWTDVTEQRKKVFNSPHIGRVFYFGDNPAVPAQKVVFLVHGTFAGWSSDFASTQSAIFRSIQYQYMGRYPSVELVSFQWSGKNDNEARISGGLALANAVNGLYRNQAITVEAIAHSHGGNVVKVATHGIQRPFNRVMTLYTPVRLDDPIFSPNEKGFVEWNNYYSTGDHVQLAGAVYVDRWGFHMGGARKMGKHDGRVVRNIRVQDNGFSPIHVRKENVVATLLDGVETLQRMYPKNREFDINIESPAPGARELFVALRHANEDAPEEKAASKQDEVRYRMVHGKEIGYKGWKFFNALKEAWGTLVQ